MKTLEITSPIANFGKLAGVSAHNENNIDFLHDPSAAKLSTTAFCADELAKYLAKTDPALRCIFADKPSGKKLSITLECTSDEHGDGGFSFIVRKKGQLIIRAFDRNGLVNGTYELLRLQGWRWLEPGADGEFAPAPHPVILPEKDRDFKPSFKYRVFYFEYSSQASIDFLMWMAHNRMNVFGSFPELKPMAQKLGMYIQAGGHIVTASLDPKRIMLSGKTLLEEHPEWYGVRPDGQKVTAENARNTQFCCSNAELMDFLADELISNLNHKWLGVDILSISGFDTWGSTCQCPKCRKYTDTDKYILFMSAIRNRFNKAYKAGKLIRNPMLCMSAYDGTATMNAPTHIPKNMIKAKDNCIANVILRCYKHSMGLSKECPVNARYGKVFKDWGKFSKELTLWGGEYYNVSRHEDLPLLFIDNMVETMKFYYKAGARGMRYMHTPVINWGMRGITQGLHAALSWDINLDAAAFCQEFLNLRYGEFACVAGSAYAEIEEASRDVSAWRSWGGSILCKLHDFEIDGDASKSLASYHYKDNADVIRSGRKIAAHYRSAAKLIETILDAVDEEYQPVLKQKLAVNPEEAARERTALRQFHFLECDLRLLNYAVDVITLMTGCAEIYDAIGRKDQKRFDLLYAKLKKQARRMSLETESVSYRAHVPYFETLSRLERSQCGSFIRMLKTVKLKGKK